MRPVVFSISALLLSAAILQLGNGLQFTLLPLRADAALFGATAIALIGSGYFAGFLLGSVIGPSLIGSVGHIRVLTAVLTGVSALVLLYPLAVHPMPWIVARFGTGLCLSIAYMAIESWLNERMPSSMRGTLFSLYSLVSLLMIAAGQSLLGMYSITGYELFSLVAIFSALAALPVALTRAPAPIPVPHPRLRLGALLAVSRVAVAGSICVGLSNSAFWVFGPIFTQRAGMGPGTTGLFMATAVVGGALMMWPIGILSDRMDRRTVAAGLSFVAAVAAAGVVVFAGRSTPLLLLSTYLFGAGAFALYPICVAHANDHADPGGFVRISSGLLFLLGASSFLGPLLIPPLMTRFGATAIFGYIATVHAAGAIVIGVLQHLRPPVPAAEKEEFRPVPRTTAAVLQWPKNDGAT